MAKGGSETPLMKQYNAVKAQYPGTLLLFRMGDFYETFGEDAVITARILGITLTKRNNGVAGDIELAGFPHHALDTYVHKLVKAGQRVAICEQLEDPKQAKGIVKRGVTEILTPGIALNDKLLDHKTNNYLAALFFPAENICAAAFIDLSTADFFCLSGELPRIEKLLYSLQPSEVVLPRRDVRRFNSLFGDDFYTYRLEDWVFEYDYALQQVLGHFRVASVKGFGLEDEQPGTTAAGVLLHYLNQMEQKQLGHLTHLYAFRDDTFCAIDKYTLRNLELLHPLFADGRSFFQTIDLTGTPMGGRLLKRWIAFPLRDVARIQARQQQVQALVDHRPTRDSLGTLLQHIADLERLVSKLATRRLNPREATTLRDSLGQIPELKALLNPLAAFARLQQAPDHEPIRQLLAAMLADECPPQLSQGGVIRTGVDADLDENRSLRQDVKAVLEDIRQREALATGISSLKISYNKVFGYYLEVSQTHQDKVPAEWIRKQTLANAERYITPELKTLEDKILGAEDRIAAIESRLYEQLLTDLQPHIAILQQWATLVAEADVLRSLAELAVRRHYCLPKVDDSGIVDITEGRHPVIETLLPADQPYIPNSVYLDSADQQILIITGPNMAGKSALLRQTALIALMAQMGSYVPAQAARIGVVDRIFTRVGASDNLSAGESTFMVEMTETARILNNCTRHSLILMDEIGRGTSTYDGVSIAWALVEYLHAAEDRAAKTLFATHYHELALLSEQLERVRNYNVSVKEIDGKIIFMRKLQPGHSAHSFGIQVAQMAGMPPVVVARAQELLAHFEQEKSLVQQPGFEAAQKVVDQGPKLQLRLFEQPDAASLRIRQILESVDPERLTPVEALLKLVELKHIVE